MASLYVAVRVFHVLLAAFWAGSILYSALILDPAVREAGPEGGKLMGTIQRRGWMSTILTVASLTVVSGFYLLWVMSGNFSPGLMGSRRGVLLSIGMAAAVVALGIGLTLARPTVDRIGQISGRVASAGGSPSADDLAELALLRERMTTLLRVVALLMVIALVTMAMGPHM
mgnify:CR=1 FL=1